MTREELSRSEFQRYSSNLFLHFGFLEDRYGFKVYISHINNEIVVSFKNEKYIIKVEFFIPSPPIVFVKNLKDGGREENLFRKNKSVKKLSSLFLKNIIDDIDKWLDCLKEGCFDELINEIFYEYSEGIKKLLNNNNQR